jgi:hypothetical protein
VQTIVNLAGPVIIEQSITELSTSCLFSSVRTSIRPARQPWHDFTGGVYAV